ncbi:MAG: sugar phosphate isomerase/epimerase [bacterium]|nr:sugar phosphate isomerase/epimerase [bacterium]
MKIGFTSRVCPEWDLSTIVTRAAELGFDGVELGTLQGETHLPAVAALADDPDKVKRLFADRGVELVCLGTGESLEPYSVQEVEKRRAKIIEVIELAGRLGCPYVRVPIGNIPDADNRDRTLARLAEVIEPLAAPASRCGVSVLVENGGDFAGSEPLWFVIDHAAHPAVGACWNPCVAMVLRERPTVSIPRLGIRARIVRVCDGTFDDQGRFGGYRVPGDGDVELRRMIELLRGIIFSGYLMFDWPKAVMPDLPDAAEVLPTVQARLREWIDTKSDVLTAYKGDKKPVHLDLPGVEVPPPPTPKVVKPT